MQILIIGGYGEFGGRLAELLIRDGHEVFIAGRNKNKAEEFCQRVGGKPVVMDVNLSTELIGQLNVDVVVDAAGPYQQHAQHADPYRVAKAALSANAHYFDLSDDGNFSKGIETLDAEAKRKQRCAFSGASSTPTLSGAAVTELSQSFDRIDTIETSILPGSKAPMGRSVMLAILNQVGEPIPLWQNNEWVNHTGWTSAKKIRLNNSLERTANLINAADAVLFPDYFKASSVTFRAGLAMPLMHRSLQLLASLRAIKCLPKLVHFIKPLSLLARLIAPLGNDRGGMRVTITGRETEQIKNNTNRWHAADWCLTAEPGQGPYVPTIAVRALIANLDNLKPGARVCINELSLKQLESAMHDIGTCTAVQRASVDGLFKQVLQNDWSNLPEAIKASHSYIHGIVLQGEANVERGSSPFAWFLSSIFRFPATSKGIPVTVRKTRSDNAEQWQRNFAGQVFHSTLSPVPAAILKASHQTDGSLIQEQFGLLKFVLRLTIETGRMHYEVQSGRCLGLAIPKLLLPISDTSEYTEHGRMHFSVKLLAPLGLGLIVHYTGWLDVA